jgi:phospho-N-acetylmuramoyl-pentapeptide-transferase
MVIRYFERKDVGEVIREDGPTTHKQKEGTPTMGGIIILLSGLFSILLWGNFYSHYLWIALLGTLLFGLLGFVDDYIKVYKKEKKAISPKVKLFFQFIISLLVVVLIAFFPADGNQVYKLYIPFIKANTGFPIYKAFRIYFKSRIYIYVFSDDCNNSYI